MMREKDHKKVFLWLKVEGFITVVTLYLNGGDALLKGIISYSLST